MNLPQLRLVAGAWATGGEIIGMTLKWWRVVVGVIAATAVLAVIIPRLAGDDSPAEVTATLERATAQSDDEPARAPTTSSGNRDAEPPGAQEDPAAPPGGSAPDSAPPSTVAAAIPEPICDNFVSQPPTDHESRTDHEQVGREQDRYLEDAGIVQRYGQRHPDEFVGVQFLNGPEVRLGIAFTNDLAAHCENLRAILEHPDDFDLWQLPWSEQELRRLQEDVNAAAGELLRSSGTHFGGPVEVHLRADGEWLARQLWERHGEMLDLRVGLHRYPPERASSPSPRCEAPAATDGPTAGVEAVLELDDPEVERGHDGVGTLTVTNRGVEPITVSMQPRSAQLNVPGSDRPSAVRDATTAPAVGYDDRELQIGESASVPVTFGTAACELSDGYALRAGDYHAVTTIEIRRNRESTLVHSVPAPLRVHG